MDSIVRLRRKNFEAYPKNHAVGGVLYGKDETLCFVEKHFELEGPDFYTLGSLLSPFPEGVEYKNRLEAKDVEEVAEVHFIPNSCVSWEAMVECVEWLERVYVLAKTALPSMYQNVINSRVNIGWRLHIEVVVAGADERDSHHYEVQAHVCMPEREQSTSRVQYHSRGYISKPIRFQQQNALTMWDWIAADLKA